jgi:hypothetical protein
LIYQQLTSRLDVLIEMVFNICKIFYLNFNDCKSGIFLTQNIWKVVSIIKTRYFVSKTRKYLFYNIIKLYSFDYATIILCVTDIMLLRNKTTDGLGKVAYKHNLNIIFTIIILIIITRMTRIAQTLTDGFYYELW